MKRINRKIILPALAALIIAFCGCEKNFLDVNNDPNRVTDDNITPELIFPVAAHITGAAQASLNFRFANHWMGYTAVSGSFAIDQTETTYNIDFPFGDALWQNTYNVLFDLYLTKQKALAKGDSVLAGASMMLSAELFQILVDIYGNIPYSQAFKNDQYRQPAYDKAKDIYVALLNDLNLAISYMQKTAKSSFAGVDIVNRGDQVKWIKFANTLKLRMLIRQSEVAGFSPVAEITKIIATGGMLHSGESVSVNPGYANETNKQSPFYANYGLTPTGADANNVDRANQYFVNLLKNTNDPRLPRYFKIPSVGGAITGTTYGLSAGNPDGSNSSTVGAGLAGSATQNQWILTSVESMFLEAEAIARGWISGDPQSAYQAAVTESFAWLGVPNAESAAATYMNSNTIADWANVGGTALSKSKFITYQKYIALACIDPLESWSDLRRLNMIPNTGYISVNPGKISPALPVRLLYPQSEYTSNAKNVNDEGSINQFTSKIFWQP